MFPGTLTVPTRGQAPRRPTHQDHEPDAPAAIGPSSSVQRPGCRRTRRLRRDATIVSSSSADSDGHRHRGEQRPNGLWLRDGWRAEDGLRTFRDARRGRDPSWYENSPRCRGRRRLPGCRERIPTSIANRYRLRPLIRGQRNMWAANSRSATPTQATGWRCDVPFQPDGRRATSGPMSRGGVSRRAATGRGRRRPGSRRSSPPPRSRRTPRRPAIRR